MNCWIDEYIHHETMRGDVGDVPVDVLATVLRCERWGRK
jgi:hypothetical protein